MRQINVKFVLILMLVALLGGGGIFALNRWQVSRNAGSLRVRAEKSIQEGNKGEALQLLARYVGMRPDDAEAYGAFSKLLLEAAQEPGAGRTTVQQAFSALETAVRKAPDDLLLRQRLAKFQLAIGRPGDAREHLLFLRDNMPAAPTDAGAADSEGGPGSAGDDSAGGNDDEKPLTKGEVDMLLARALMGTGRFDEAADVLANVIGYDRSSKAFRDERPATKDETDAYILLAAILDDELRGTTEAEAVLVEGTRVNADDPRAWLAMRGWHAKRGDDTAAARDLAKAVEVAPDDLETLMASFEVAIRQRALVDAERVVTRAGELFPEEERVVRAQAMLALQQGERSKAIELLRSGLQKMPQQAALLLMLADTLLQEGQIDETDSAVARLEGIVGDGNPAVGLLRARVLMARQQWLEAQQFLEQLRPKAVVSADITRQIDLYLGQCFEKLGRFDQQLEANQRVLSDDPNSVAARVGAAAALAATGRKDQALAEYEIIYSAMAPEDLSAFPQLWNPLLQLRIDQQLSRTSAERDWSKVDALVDQLGSSPRINDAQIAILRADVLVRKESTDEALALLRDAVRRDPANESLLGALATLSLRFEGQASAKSVLEEAPDEARQTPTVMLLEARVAAAGPADEGATWLAEMETRSAGLSGPSRTQVRNGLALAFLELGRADDAERIWRESLEESPDDITVWNAIFRMAEQRDNSDLVAEASREIARIAGTGSAEARVAEAASTMMRIRTQAQARAADGVEVPIDAEAKNTLQKVRGLLIEAENGRRNWAEIQLRFADLALLERDLDTAIERLKQAARLTPGNTLITRRLVTLLYTAGRAAEAEQAMALLRPEDMGGLDRITADIQVRSGNLDEAVAIAERAVSRDSDNVEELTWLGQLLARSGRLPEAIGIYQRVVELAPDRQDAWLALVSLQASDGQQNAAAVTLQKATDALPSPTKELVAAQGAEMLGDLDDAENRLRAAVGASDDAFEAGQALASFLIRRGRLDEAREELQAIIDRDIRLRKDLGVKTWARRLLAEMLAEQGTYRELEEALALIEANVDEDGQLSAADVTLQIRLLAARIEPASWRLALDRIDLLGKKQPLTVEQRLVQAQLLDKLGRWDEARNALVSLLGTTDPPPMIYAALIEKLIAHDELSSATMWLDRLRQKAPNTPMTLALTAKLAVAQDDRASAVEAAKRLMPTESISDDQVGQLRNTAMLMEDLGFAKAADQLWQDYATRSGDGVLARAEFLGRQGETTTALEMLQAAWDQLPLERILQSGIIIARNEGATPSNETSTRLDGWFAKAVKLDPGSPTIALLEAELRELQGRTDDVEKIYRELMARDDLAATQKAIVANNLAFHLAKPDTADEAGRLITEAIDQLGPHPDLLDTRGLVELVRGNLQQSVADLEEAVLAPTAAKYLHLAEAQLASKQMVAARRSLEQARSLGLDADKLSRADRARLEKVEAALSSPLGA